MAEVVLVSASDTFTHVAVRGRLDAAGVGQVDVRLTMETVSRRKPAVMDMSEVTMIASLGIGMLVAIARSMSSHQLGFAVVSGSSPVKSMLAMTSVDMMFPVVTTHEEALKALGLE